MKFRISRAEPISWPDKCVWCSGKPTMRYEDSVKGLFGGGLGFLQYAKIKIDYPACRKHGLWLSILRTVYPFSLAGVVLGLMIHYIVSLFFCAVFLWNLLLRPIIIRKVTKYFYTLIIRNGDYGREFALLNSLDPL